MIVYLVITEFKRGSDMNGGYALETVAASRRAAFRRAANVSRSYRDSGMRRCKRSNDSPEWDFDITIEEAEVIQ